MFEVLNQVESATGTLEKQSYLTQADAKIKNLLYLCYNPYLQFYIKKIPIVSPSNTVSSEENYNQFMILLSQLATREITGNSAVAAVSKFLEHCNSTEQKWYSRVLQKDLKFGIAVTGINKAFPKLIPTYEVMLADKVPTDLTSAKAMKLLPENMVCQYKIDGYRLNIHRPSVDEVVMCTRNGKQVYGYTQLESIAKQLPVGYVYDGEIVSPELLHTIGQYSNNRDMFSTVMSHAFSKEINKEGIFNIFDIVSLDDWRKRSNDIPYIQRVELMKELIDPELDIIQIVPTTKVFHKNSQDLQSITDLFHDFLNMGWEGLMIKDADAPYQWKRTKSLLKMKLMDTMDVTVLEVYNGTGKYADKLGGVYVDYKGNKLGVGSGFTDYQRDLFWNQPNEIVGKTIEVAYQAISHNKEGKESVSFPVFKGIRGDK